MMNEAQKLFQESAVNSWIPDKSKFTMMAQSKKSGDSKKVHRAIPIVEKDTSPDNLAKLDFSKQLRSIKPKPLNLMPIDLKPIDTKKNKDKPPQSVVNKKKMTLQYLQNELLDKVYIIRHNDGLYYFNDRTYVAIKDDADLLKLIRSKVSFDAFGVSDVRIFLSLYKYLKADDELIPKNYNKKLAKAKKLVVLKNGVLNLDTLELKEHSPKYLTFFELDANWVDDEPEVFNEFLRVSCSNEKQSIIRTKEAVGYILSGSNDAKVFFVIGIARDSGKSTLGIVIELIIGKDYVSAIPPEKLGDRFALGSNRGKILNMAMDVPEGKLNANVVSTIKSITGKDAITIEQKYMPTETIVSDTRFIFGSNYPIKLSSSDDSEEAFYQRMLIIPFTNTISDSEKDTELVEKLLKEKDAIVSNCLRHYKKVRDNNYRFSKCQVADDMLKEWKNGKTSAYSFAAFWNDSVLITGDESDSVYASDLYELYTEYCSDEALQPMPYNMMLKWIEDNIDSERCIKHRIHKTGQNPKAGYKGIRLYTDYDLEINEEVE